VLARQQAGKLDAALSQGAVGRLAEQGYVQAAVGELGLLAPDAQELFPAVQDNGMQHIIEREREMTARCKHPALVKERTVCDR
jgi:hypothetical protein